MLQNDRMETASTVVTSIQRRNDIGKSTWKTQRYLADFESWTHLEISASNRCHNFHVDSYFKIYEISTNFPRGISTSNRWRIDKDVFIIVIVLSGRYRNKYCLKSNWILQSYHFSYIIGQSNFQSNDLKREIWKVRLLTETILQYSTLMLSHRRVLYFSYRSFFKNMNFSNHFILCFKIFCSFEK